MVRQMLIFDMDGTLTDPVQVINNDVKDILRRCKRKNFEIAVVSGSKYEKIKGQLNDGFIDEFDYVFSENGTQVYVKNVLVKSLDITEAIPETKLRKMVEFCLRYIADLDIPTKRGTFIEHRKSLINICPPGRNCSMVDRRRFVEYDSIHHVRQKLIQVLKSQFDSDDCPLSFVAGGQISIDVYPKAWSKSIALSHIGKCDVIHFFGDNTREGGNDFEIYNHPDVIGHTVTGYKDLVNQLEELLAKS
uniref:Phosphomannomutase n=1 Tax=Babesia bovis TaxID=5865 RepID=PMM_BABBO|nr:RecName: Full=Phosphomannomutase [Babesia bovis]AAC27385.1 phosphomannomutase homolog [Babesia bovis]